MARGGTLPADDHSRGADVICLHEVARTLPAPRSTAEGKPLELPQPESLASRETTAGATPSPGPVVSTTDKTNVSPSVASPPAPVGPAEVALEATQTPAAAHVSPALAQPQPATAPTGDIARPVVAALPRVLITVDKASQRMRVTVDGKLRHSWAVLTARAPYKTPAGTFHPLRLAKEHYSREWDDAPMPYSIFFTAAGHAIHASTATRRLGRPASHGCVRLAPANAAALFALVRTEGPSATKVTVTNGVTAGRTARSRTAEVRARVRAHHAPPAPADIWQVGSGYGLIE